MAAVEPIPDGYRNLTPYPIAVDGAGAVAFSEKAFGAAPRLRCERPDGKIDHAELEIGDSVITLADEYPPHQALAPAAHGGSPIRRAAMAMAEAGG